MGAPKTEVVNTRAARKRVEAEEIIVEQTAIWRYCQFERFGGTSTSENRQTLGATWPKRRVE